MIDKVAVVTGGSSGIGKAIAAALASNGARVVIAARREALGVTAAAELRRDGAEVKFVQTDVTDEAQVAHLMAVTQRSFGSVDILVNNAGHGCYGTILDVDRKQWDAVIEANLTSVYLCTRQALLAWMQAHGGAVLNIASGAGTNGIRGMAAYASAKAGVVNLTRCLAVDLAPYGVRVNCLSPGFVVTPALSASLAGSADKGAFMDKLAKRYPVGRLGQPEDIAQAAISVLGAEFITGVNLPVDGGVSCYN